MNKKVYIGLDLGIRSVGWSLVDENQNIIATGSHLFSQLSNDKNKYGERTRGEYRRKRRNLRRRKQRKIDFLNMIDKFCFTNQQKFKKIGKLSSFYKEKYQNIFKFNSNESASDFLSNINENKYDVWKIYREGFERELSPKELFLFLYFKLSFRGVFFLHYTKPENYNYEESLLKKQFNDNYWLKNNKYRSKSNADDQFSIYWNWADIEYICKKCTYIDDEFIDDYKNIFLSHRDFSKGPGSFKSISKWGLKYDENGNPTKNNLWDYKLSKCLISSAKNSNIEDNNIEGKALKLYCFPEIANIISQLINTKIKNTINNSDCLNFDSIIKILDKSLFDGKNIDDINIKKWLNLGENVDLFGYPLTKDKTKSNFEKLTQLKEVYFKKDNPIFIFKNNQLKSIKILIDYIYYLDLIRYHLICGWNKKIDQHNDLTDCLPCDNCNGFYINQKNEGSNLSKEKKEYNKKCTNNKDIEKCKLIAKQIVDNLQWKNVDFEINFDALCNFNNIGESDFSNSYNYGLTAFKEYIIDYFFVNNNKQLSNFNVYFKDEIKKGKLLSYDLNNKSIFLNKNMYDKQDFISKNALNTIKESLKIINQIWLKYIFNNKDLILDSICLETTWENNEFKNTLLSKEKQKEICKYQIQQEKNKNKAKEVAEKYGIDANEENIKKLMLLIEQDYIDIYTGKSLREHLHNIEKFQIDHIIPESISFNSNLENLVVTMKNSSKGNKTPIQYLSSTEFKNLKEGVWYELYGKDDKDKYKAKKYKYLTLENGEEYNQGFINSNLTETTYAISKLKEGLELFFKNLNNKYEYKNDKRYMQIQDCSIRTISGFWSQTIRKYFKLEKKDREKDKSHHAVDATLCAIYFSLRKVRDLYDFIDAKAMKWNYIDNETKTEFMNKNLFYIKDNKLYLNIEPNYNKRNDITNAINNIICEYSYKNVFRIPDQILKKINKKQLSNQQKMDELKKIQYKKIFSEENFIGYKSSGEQKLKKAKYDLISSKDGDRNNIYKIFLEMNKFIKKNNIDNLSTNESIIQINKFKSENSLKYKILTNSNLLIEMYKILINYNKSDGLESFDFSKEFNPKNDNIFDNYYKYINETNNTIQKICNESYDYIIKNYLPLMINDKLIKVKFIRIIKSDKYSPAFIYDDKSNIAKNKWILNNEQSQKLNKNKSLYGNATKAIAILKFMDNKKEKFGFFKINEMNMIVNSPACYEILQIIDYDRWFKIDNKIYRIDDFDISNNKIKIQCVSHNNSSNKNQKEEYEYSFNKFLDSNKFDNDTIQWKIAHYFGWDKLIEK